jgi:hypothetical protein
VRTTVRTMSTEDPPFVCTPHEVVPAALREYLRWDSRHDRTAAAIMQEFGLYLPRDRELIRQLAFVRVAQGIAADTRNP